MQSVTVQEQNKAKEASGPVPTRRRLSQLLGHQASHRTGDAGEADKPADSPAHAPAGDAGGADCNRSVHMAEARTCEADSSRGGGEHRAAAAGDAPCRRALAVPCLRACASRSAPPACGIPFVDA